MQRLNSRNKKLSTATDDGGLRPGSSLSVKSRRHKDSTGNQSIDKVENKKTSNVSSTSSGANTNKKISQSDSGINNSNGKNTNITNRKSSMCLIL